MNLQNCTTPKPNSFLMRVWGSFWSGGVGARELGTDSLNFWFDTPDERKAALDHIESIAARQDNDHKTVVYAFEHGPTVDKRTVACMELELNGKRYPIEYDFNYGFEEDSAVFMFEEGNYSCDCNKSLFLRKQHPEEGIEEVACGDTIRIHNFTIRYDA